MRVIAIDLNGVVRNLNKQICKYYQKEFDPSLDLDDIDYTDNVVGNICKFESKMQKNNFFHIDYPFEIYGCAKEIEQNVQTFVNTWIIDHCDDAKIIYFTYNEGELATQSTYYYLGKTGCRVKEMHFITNPEDIWEFADAVVSAEPEFFYKDAPKDKCVFRINRKSNENIDDCVSVKGSYDQLSNFLEDYDNVFKQIDNAKKEN